MGNNANEKDLMFGRNINRPHYCITGSQWGTSSEDEISGKRPTDGPPMSIGLGGPGSAAHKDSQWSLLFGGSLDNTFSIINGRFVETSIDEISIAGIYKEGVTNADDYNIWKKANGENQVQYAVTKNTVAEAFDATDDFGELNEVRSFGIRMPVMVGGWGRTIDGLPTDPDPTTDGPGRQNDDGHKLARETWKYGPIDLRWDYRRGVWAAFNDLIADHKSQGLGTWVFGTNADDEQGFPFLRARLEDVWWVRKPVDKRGSRGQLQGEATGEIFTHLLHRWYDDEHEGAARLNTLFVIPHLDVPEDHCGHTKLEEYELDDENTGDGDRIDIRSTAHFWMDDDIDGPLFFNISAASDIIDKICCNPGGGKFFTGKMIFMDEAAPACRSSNQNTLGQAFVSTGSLPVPCSWAPAVQIDECELSGGHFKDLFENDIKIMENLNGTCNAIAGWSEKMANAASKNFAGVDTAIKCVMDEMQALATATSELIAKETYRNAMAINGLAETITDAFADMNTRIDNLIAAIQACCEIQIDDIAPPVIFGFALDSTDVPKLEVGDCPYVADAIPSYDCGECGGEHLTGPCITPRQLLVGFPCGDGTRGSYSMPFGDCMIHDHSSSNHFGL